MCPGFPGGPARRAALRGQLAWAPSLARFPPLVFGLLRPLPARSLLEPELNPREFLLSIVSDLPSLISGSATGRVAGVAL